MQLLQRMGGGGGLLVGDGAKMDDLKNTGFRRKAQGNWTKQNPLYSPTTRAQVCAAFQNRGEKKVVPRVEKSKRCLFMQPTCRVTPISQTVYVNTSQFDLVWT